MIIFHHADALSRYLQQARSEGSLIGFVPTMGALHAGHISLIDRARAQNQLVVCSIFVNPTQFNDPKDLAAYPRTLPEDIALLDAAGCHVLFVPSVSEIYPDNLPVEDYTFGLLENIFEGAFRPGHFKGVGQVVSRLLRLTTPHTLYLGQKDYQQCMVITDLIRQMHWEDVCRVEICPTHREKSGLARSSRNQRLSPEGLQSATALYRVLLTCRQQYTQYTPALLQERALASLAEDPCIKPEYFAFVHPQTLEPVTAWNKQPVVWVLIAAWVDGVRLIDNDFLFM